MKKILLFGCLTIILLVVGTSVFIGWKVASTIAGKAKPHDLGQSATMEQAIAVQAKTQVTVTILPASSPLSGSMRFEGSHPMTYELTSAELTALALSHARYKYFPFKNIQIRINPDNSVEVSAVVDTMKAFSYATAIGFAASDLEKVMTDYHIPKSTIPVYVKGSGSVTNNRVSLELDAGDVAGIPVPMGLVNDKKPQIVGILEDMIRITTGLNAKSITFSGSKVHFDGNVPERKYIVE
jgi:hypothetical protein